MPVREPILENWPTSGLEAVPLCPACGSSRRQLLHSELVDLAFASPSGPWRMQGCSDCGCGYLDPRPTADTIARAYAHYYTHQGVVAPAGLWATLRHALRDDHFAARLGRKGAATIWPGRHLLSALPPLREGLETLVARNLPGPGEGRRLLDVGCGNGEYLAFARQSGWRVEGVDFDPRAVATARGLGLEVTEGGIDTLAAEDERYDRITLSHVIEHVYDPVDVLRQCHRLLKPGGTLWLETPNVNAFGHTAFGPAWRGLEVPRHLVVFSHAALLGLLEKAGFADVRNHFNMLGIRLIWNESRALLTKAGGAPGRAHGTVARWRAELAGRAAPERREFITVSCQKPR